MLIGLHGASRSGKDSVASFLIRNHAFRQVALADNIRQILLDLNPWLRINQSDDFITYGELVQLKWLYEDCDGDWDQIKARSTDATDLMIRLGQSARENISENVWINSALPTGYSQRHDGRVVISDIRQPNEVEYLYRHGGELWYVERPNGSEKRGMDGLLQDVTFDAWIVNSGSLEDLEATVDKIVKETVE